MSSKFIYNSYIPTNIPFSDGKTPEEQVKQILAVTPILKGQKSSTLNAIPAHHRKENHNPSSDHSNAEVTNGSASNQKALEETLSNTSTKDAKEGGPLIDFHEDLKEALPQGKVGGGDNVLKRQDTDTQSLDEFVDAES